MEFLDKEIQTEQERDIDTLLYGPIENRRLHEISIPESQDYRQKMMCIIFYPILICTFISLVIVTIIYVN